MPNMYFPPNDQPWWDETRERMNPAERERLIVKRLRALLREARENTLYYHEVLKNVDIESINSFEDYAKKVPITTKAILREEQSKYPPFGSLLAKGSWSFVLASSGTTGKPTYVPFSMGDTAHIEESFARIMWSFGVRPGMKIMISALFSLYAGSWGVYFGARRLNLSIITTGAGVAGMTSQAVRTALDLKPEILYGTPSYILHFLEVSKEMGVDGKRDFNFKIIFGSGEPGLALPNFKKKIKEILGNDVKVIDTGSMVEAMPWITNAECSFENGPHLWQDIVYTELIDPNDASLKAFGEEGVLTYTPLYRHLYPIIRYFSGDIATWTNEPCPCGRTYPRLPKGIYGRVDDMFIVKGVKVWPSFIQEVLEKSKYFGGEFRIVISREKEVDVLRLIVEVDEDTWRKIGADPSERERISSEFRKLTRDNVGINSVIELVSPGSLERATHKAKRVINERTLGVKG